MAECHVTEKLKYGGSVQLSKLSAGSATTGQGAL